MKSLDKKYQTQLERIAAEIQNSDTLESFLNDESEELFKELQIRFEPAIAAVYSEVANEQPLQIIPLEKALLKDDFEGLFIPKILAYSVLRGEVNARCKFVRQQDHMRDIIQYMLSSPNFEYIRKRSGQTIQMGFALSSDIYITNLIESVENKKLQQYLIAQKQERLRDQDERIASLKKYRNQFKHDVYFTADFPNNLNELKVYYNSLRDFLHVRFARRLDNSSLKDSLLAFLHNPEFTNELEFVTILGYTVNFIQYDKKEAEEVAGIFNHARKSFPDFNKHYFEFVNYCLHSEIDLDAEADNRVMSFIDQSIKDDISSYYNLVNTIHTKGYIHEDTVDAVKNFYEHHAGQSIVNECVRMVIYNYFEKLLTHLEPSDYQTFFDLSKVYQTYFDIFSNEHFTQAVKHLSLDFTNKLLKVFTDKRGKDYQEVKRFVSATFVDFGFLKEKEVVEMFKTRKKVVS